MSCIKLSVGTRLLLIVVAMVIACGFVPLFLINHGTPGNADLVALSSQVDKLEREHKELKDFISKLELRPVEQPIGVDEILGFLSTLPSHRSSKSPIEQFISATEFDSLSSVVFREPITFNTPESQSRESVLVVGGTGNPPSSLSIGRQNSSDVKVNIFTSYYDYFCLVWDIDT